MDKKEKNDTLQEQVRSDVTLLHENKQLKEKIEALTEREIEMSKELTHYKKVSSGLRGQNNQLRSKIVIKDTRINELEEELELASMEKRKNIPWYKRLLRL